MSPAPPDAVRPPHEIALVYPDGGSRAASAVRVCALDADGGAGVAEWKYDEVQVAKMLEDNRAITMWPETVEVKVPETSTGPVEKRLKLPSPLVAVATGTGLVNFIYFLLGRVLPADEFQEMRNGRSVSFAICCVSPCRRSLRLSTTHSFLMSIATHMELGFHCCPVAGDKAFLERVRPTLQPAYTPGIGLPAVQNKLAAEKDKGPRPGGVDDTTYSIRPLVTANWRNGTTFSRYQPESNTRAHQLALPMALVSRLPPPTPPAPHPPVAPPCTAPRPRRRPTRQLSRVPDGCVCVRTGAPLSLPDGARVRVRGETAVPAPTAAAATAVCPAVPRQRLSRQTQEQGVEPRGHPLRHRRR